MHAVLIEKCCLVPGGVGGRRAARRRRKRSHPYSSRWTCTCKALLICRDRGKLCWGGRRQNESSHGDKRECLWETSTCASSSGPGWPESQWPAKSSDGAWGSGRVVIIAEERAKWCIANECKCCPLHIQSKLIHGIWTGMTDKWLDRHKVS